MKIGYARVSTHEQNLDLQIDALKKEGCEMIFKEKVSSRKDNRPERDNMMNQIRKGDTLVIWKIDRYARSITELTKLVKVLSEKEAHLKVINGHIDTSTASGRLLFHILAVIAEFERDMISERTKAGLAAARARGKKGGRPPGLSKKNQKKAKTAASLYKARDLSIAEITEQLEISRATLYKYLRLMGVEIGKD